MFCLPKTAWPPTCDDPAGVVRGMANLYFDFNKFDIRADQQANAGGDAKVLQKCGEVKVVISGHCDERGSNEYNMALGAKRAESVAEFLKMKGVSAKQLKTVSYGEERPADPGHDEAAWAKNRRAEFALQK